MPYKIIGKHHWRPERMYEIGEEIDPSEDELRVFPHRFEQLPARRGRPPGSVVVAELGQESRDGNPD